jgi:hypothetical protein
MAKSNVMPADAVDFGPEPGPSGLFTTKSEGPSTRPGLDGFFPRPETGHAQFRRLWKFWLDTGFIYRAKLESLKPYLTEIFDTGAKLMTCPEDLCKTALKEQDGRISNSLVMTRSHPGTWLVHHMASLRNPVGMLDLLLESVSWLLDHPEAKYARLYWRPNNKKVHNLFLGLKQAFIKGGADTVKFDEYAYHHLDLGKLGQRLDLSDGSVTASAMSKDERFEVAGLLRKTLGEVDFQVESLDPRNLELSGLNDMYRSSGLSRNREIFVARQRGRVLGIALADCSSLGLNFSFYLNTFKIVLVDQTLDEAAKQAVFERLLLEVCRFYGRQGRGFAVTLADQELDRQLNRLSFRSSKRYCCLTLSKTSDRSAGLKYIERFYRKKMRLIKIDSTVKNIQRSASKLRSKLVLGPRSITNTTEAGA